MRRLLLLLPVLAGLAAAGCSADVSAEPGEASEDELVFRGVKNAQVDMSMPDVDAIGYEIDLRIDESKPEKETYRATTRGTFVATRALRELELDFVGNDIESLTVGGKPASFTRDHGTLRIELPSQVAKGRAFVVETKYHGAVAQADGANPNDFAAFGGLQVLQRNTNGKKIYASLNWPSKGRRWIPMRDHPRDGAMLAMRATFPDKYVVLSNGKRTSVTKNGDGTKTWLYEALTPMPVYDFSLTAYDDWAESEATSKSGVSIHTYTYSSSTTNAREIYEDAPAAMDVYESIFGPFRWGQLSYVEEPIFGGGMEHATVISMDQSLFTSTKDTRRIAFHELGHHWSGNLVRCATWNDFWLSEGFTEYLTRRAIEGVDGAEAARTLWRSTLARALEAEASNQHALRPPDPEIDVLEIFDDIPYEKGAWVVRMLEARLGREKMDKVLRGWFERHAFSAVTTDILRDEIAKELGDAEARAFFDQFVFTAGHPVYAVTTAPKDGKVEIRVEQVQTEGPKDGYDFPLTVELSRGAQKQRVQIAVSGKVTTTLAEIPFDAQVLRVDPDEVVYGSVVCDDASPCKPGYVCAKGKPRSVCTPR
jgi:aminopeptidase N